MEFASWADYHSANKHRRKLIRRIGSSSVASIYEIAAVVFLDFSDAKIDAVRNARFLSKNDFVADFMGIFGLTAKALPEPGAQDTLRFEPFSVRFKIIEAWEGDQKSGSSPEAIIAQCLDDFYHDDITCFRSAKLVDPMPFVRRAAQVIHLVEADANLASDSNNRECFI